MFLLPVILRRVALTISPGIFVPTQKSYNLSSTVFPPECPYRTYGYIKDIKLGNILLNHFAFHDDLFGHNEMRIFLRKTNQIRYALCDFDWSLVLSPSPSEKPIRLPGEVSFDIYQEKPYDTSQGEPDYDPFAFDIGCLGIFFWDVFFVSLIFCG